MFLIANMSEDSVYNVLVLNACDDADRPTAAIANLDVDLENALEASGSR